ncbi:hypothetical protein E5288_WYG009314 [Bos mutus]|uniref:Uncharacterized protein n=1 Tax=Bos mutus TaxID=72004 RepID=A0A6B0RZL4_9CETA|nr:hypothetical protein [Bos mutus]
MRQMPEVAHPYPPRAVSQPQCTATSEAEDVGSAVCSQAHWPPLKINQLQSEKVNDRFPGLVCYWLFRQSRGWNVTL